ncbi:MAG: 50S ribosomal protein L18 [Deltaproteobacteria bacterium]|jgi:large subunit ribosomal protein L18|nr:50S ribosomal protein L18 [Deltaproteobacteria bacterium]
MATQSKVESRRRRHHSLRKRIAGTPERPRLVVYRSARHIYAQVIDDLGRKTLAAASDLLPKKDPPADAPQGKKRDRAKQVGTLVAKRCIEKGIAQVVFDRAGYRYHGRVSQVASGAREAGLKF